MKTRRGVRSRTQAGRSAAPRRSTWVTFLSELAATLLLLAIGCGVQRVEQKSAATQGGKDSMATVAAKPGTKVVQTGLISQGVEPSGPTTRVRLTQKGCVQIEPDWTSVGVGQSLTWHSELKSPVTIHVSPGAFDKAEYVVRAGATTSTGPARKAGSYSIWTTPAACQGVPRGVQGAGPGVTVEGAGKL